jgi:hypothetical protein
MVAENAYERGRTVVECRLMKRLLVLLLATSIAVAASLVSLACGGPDKPPLTPDTDTPSVDGADSGRD